MKSGSERPLEFTPTFFKDDGMDEGAAKTSSGKQGTTPTCSEFSATTLQGQQKHQHIQQHLQHPSCHLALARSLSDLSEALDTFFGDTRTPVHPKRQQTITEAVLTATNYDDGACARQVKANAGSDLLSMLEDPKDMVADGASRSLEVLDDVLMLPGNLWSDVVHEMESEKKSRVLREG